MDRGQARAAWVAAAAVAVWLTLTVLHWSSLSEREQVPLPRGKRQVRSVARHSSVIATQSLVQLCLFFALPFYHRASALDLSRGPLDPGHALFVAGLVSACAVSLWDPWTERLLRRSVAGSFLPALASFVALNAVLPALGLSTRLSLWLAAAVAALGALSLAVARVPRGQRRLLLMLTAASVGALPLGLWLGAARIVPPAPLRLARAELGTRLVDKWVEAPVTVLTSPPERLICATAIEAPVGLRDRLHHVWHLDGKPIARMQLKIVGGRREGYRTRSWIRDFEHRPTGRYGCTVTTESGQVLGTRYVQFR